MINKAVLFKEFLQEALDNVGTDDTKALAALLSIRQLMTNFDMGRIKLGLPPEIEDKFVRSAVWGSAAGIIARQKFTVKLPSFEQALDMTRRYYTQ